MDARVISKSLIDGEFVTRHLYGRLWRNTECHTDFIEALSVSRQNIYLRIGERNNVADLLVLANFKESSDVGFLIL